MGKWKVSKAWFGPWWLTYERGNAIQTTERFDTWADAIRYADKKARA